MNKYNIILCHNNISRFTHARVGVWGGVCECVCHESRYTKEVRLFFCGTNYAAAAAYYNTIFMIAKIHRNNTVVVIPNNIYLHDCIGTVTTRHSPSYNNIVYYIGICENLRID